ncbi:MAG: undecaprenyl-diphosphate phosphatase [Novosphingobium sp.]|nr:undecaprenyl-diphosphate phosphatase [Novosphingobium sp.]
MADDIATPIILGIVEGVTEYLPVSSTGHLILATELLGYDAEKWALFNIAIQPGAILAILVLYWRTFWAVLIGMTKAERPAFAFVINLLLAFIPGLGAAYNGLATDVRDRVAQNIQRRNARVTSSAN